MYTFVYVYVLTFRRASHDPAVQKEEQTKMNTEMKTSSRRKGKVLVSARVDSDDLAIVARWLQQIGELRSPTISSLIRDTFRVIAHRTRCEAPHTTCDSPLAHEPSVHEPSVHNPGISTEWLNHLDEMSQEAKTIMNKPFDLRSSSEQEVLRNEIRRLNLRFTNLRSMNLRFKSTTPIQNLFES